MKCLTSLVGVARIDRIWNEEVRRKSSGRRAEWTKLRCHVLDTWREWMSSFWLEWCDTAKASGIWVKYIQMFFGWMVWMFSWVMLRDVTVGLHDSVRRIGRSGQPQWICKCLNDDPTMFEEACLFFLGRSSSLNTSNLSLGVGGSLYRCC